jgi:hypothetical protein
MAIDLQVFVANKLAEVLKGSVELKKSPSVWMASGKILNVRTAAEKAGSKYWFDVTPRFYQDNIVDFFLFACGNSDRIYVFPQIALADLVAPASLGGAKQVPQFTIFTDTDEFEPAGAKRQSISRFLNAFDLITGPPKA